MKVGGRVEERRRELSLKIILLGTIGNVFPVFGSFQFLPIYYSPSTCNPKFALLDHKRA